MNDNNKNLNDTEIKSSCDEQSQLDLKNDQKKNFSFSSVKLFSKTKSDSGNNSESKTKSIKEKSKGYDFTSVIITASAVIIAIIIVFAIFPAYDIDLLHNVAGSVSAKEILYVDESSHGSNSDIVYEEETTTTNEDAIKLVTDKVKINKVDTTLVYDEVISTSGKKASLCLTNPESNEYLESVRIYSATDNTKIYYQSDIIKPGTGLLKITLLNSIDEATPVIIEFSFYDEELNVVDTKMVAATLTPEDELTTKKSK